MRIEESVRLAHISKANGRASKREKQIALREAQAALVTHVDYLRAHLSLEIAGGDARLARDWSLKESRLD